MWQTHITLFGLMTILMLILYSSKLVKASSDEEFNVISYIDSDSKNVDSEYELPEKFKQDINYLQKFIQQEMLRIENNIAEKLHHLENKIDSKNIFSQNTKNILDIANNLEQKVNDITIKLQSLHKITNVNSVKLFVLEDSMKDNANTLNSLINITLENQKTLKFINSNDIKQATNTNLTLDNINNTTMEMVETLNRVINVSHNTSSTLNNNINVIYNNSLLVQKLLNSKRDIVQVTTSNEMPSSESQEKEWDWSRCKEERVLDDRNLNNNISRELYPLTAGGSGGAGEAQLRLAIRGDGGIWIYLSQDRLFNMSHIKLLFSLWIGNVSDQLQTDLYIEDVDRNESKYLQIVYAKTSLLSNYRDTRVALTIADDWLKVRVGNSLIPVMAQYDPRLSKMQYFGFDSSHNSQGYATFKYDC